MNDRARAVISTLLGSVALLSGCGRGSSGEPQGVGTIEITETDVAPMVAARVVQVRVREGDLVSRGDTIAMLSQSNLPADIEQRRSRVGSAEAELRDLQAGARPAELARARAELRTAEAEATRTGRDAERFRELERAGSISRSQLDAAIAAAQMAAGRRDAAREALSLAREGARPERISAARSAVEGARAQLAMVEATAADLVLLSPQNGIVLRRLAEPGEVIAAATPVVSLGDASALWVRVFVAGPVMARLAPGGRATLVLDGLEGRRFEGRISSIATSAEFTPRVALTESERADLLFGVRVELTDTTGTLKAGLPATITFDTVPAMTPSGSRRP